MKRTVAILGAAALLVIVSSQHGHGQANITGQLKKWHRVTLTFDGPETDEQANVNPFRDYRLNVTFRHGNKAITVPGFFAADGNAAKTGAAKGNKWRVHFAPDETGEWTYAVSFRTGKDIAIDPDPKAGKPLPPDGTTGKFTVGQSDKSGVDFRGKGLLRYVGKRYLRFADSGEWFLKGGADSPENFLGYADFDGTRDTGGLKRKGEAGGGKFLHTYAPHTKDWRPGDPTWQGDKGKGIIGAINYLSSKGMNSVYFLTMNVGGDGKDVWPWTKMDERFRFDCSKLDQWEIVFGQMTRKGIMLHVLTQETENDQLLDGGDLGPQRKLYYRELIARFAHHPAVAWNLGEENTNTDKQRKEFCDYIRRLDPYDHPIVCHTFPGKYDQVYTPLLGYKTFDGPSLQTNDTHRQTIKWVDRSAKAGHPWVVCLDEIGPAHTGVKPDKDDPGHDEVRRKHLWGNLMAGGAGCEWYFGYKFAHNDLNCEDWRSRDRMWDMTRCALEFFQKHLPFTEMEHADALTTAGDDYCFAKLGEVYAIYLPRGGTTKVRLPGSKYRVRWYNPRHGGNLLPGVSGTLAAMGDVSIGNPPSEPQKDWVALVHLSDVSANEVSAMKMLLRRPSNDGSWETPVKQPSTGPTAVASFTLINAETDRPIRGFEKLTGEVTLDLAKLPTRKLSLAANVFGNTGSVRFSLDGETNFRTESSAPYALAGDTNGDYNPWTPTPGAHTIVATPFAGAGARGKQGKPLTLRLKVSQ